MSDSLQWRSGLAQATSMIGCKRMPRLRNVKQDEAAKAFIRLGGEDRGTKKNYRMIRMPNGSLLQLPSGTLKIGLLTSQMRRAGLTVDQFEEALR